MRIGKRTREQAALICQISASNQPSPFWSEIRHAIGASKAAQRLAALAWATHETWQDDPRIDDAEAEALLRTGWTP
jgi:hypothetical protein